MTSSTKSAARRAVAAGLMGLAMLAGSASASTLTSIDIRGGMTTGPGASFDPEMLRGRVTCSLGCQGWLFDNAPVRAELGNGGWSNSTASAFNQGQGADEGEYRTAINVVMESLGLSSYEAGDVVKTNTEIQKIDVNGDRVFDSDGNPVKVLDDSRFSDDGGTLVFSTDSEYFFLTIGRDPRIALFRNFSLGNEVRYTVHGGTGGGLSHIVEVGVIPLPASAWLLLGGMGAMGFVGYRRRKQAA